jgi:hypothetical protein
MAAGNQGGRLSSEFSPLFFPAGEIGTVDETIRVAVDKRIEA